MQTLGFWDMCVTVLTCCGRTFPSRTRRLDSVKGARLYQSGLLAPERELRVTKSVGGWYDYEGTCNDQMANMNLIEAKISLLMQLRQIHW
jgi:hypothetical protein